MIWRIKVRRLPESKVSILVVGVVGPLLLGFAGLLVGAWFSQFFSGPTPFLPFLVPLGMNVGLGSLLLSKGARPEAGKAVMLGGTFVSLALPFILL
jgi:predicted phage tail protein